MEIIYLFLFLIGVPTLIYILYLIRVEYLARLYVNVKERAKELEEERYNK